MNKEQNSHKQIIKTTGIYGISQVVNIILGILRSKLTAIFLGTTGVGIIGLFQSIIDLNRSVTGLGLDVGATKNIATSEEKDLPKNLYTINAWYLLTGMVGALFCILFAKPLSIWTFETADYTYHILFLGIAVLFVTLSAGLISSLQGLRKISLMAFSSSISSIVSLIVMIPIYYYYGIDGIVPMLILAGLITFLSALFFYRKIAITPIKIPLIEAMERGTPMLKLGLFIVAAGIVSTVSLFLIRTYINRTEGIDEVGLFQASWLITSLMWGIILRSTNSDFFPKLCSLVENKIESNKLVNDQTYVILLIISPVLVFLITFSEEMLKLLYTSEFIPATNTLRWYLVGSFIKMISTPVATILIARNKGGLHLLVESVFWVSYLVVSYFLLSPKGIEGTGIAYVIAYVIYLPAVCIASNRISDIQFSPVIYLLFVINIIFLALFCFIFITDATYVHYVGVGCFVLALGYSVYGFGKIIRTKG